MTTQRQTVHLWFELSSQNVATLEEIPICPIAFDKSPVRVHTADAVTTWRQPTAMPGYVEQRPRQAGPVKTWLLKPTLNDAVQHKERGYFQFHSDGAVSFRSEKREFYWGPSRQGVPMEGTIVRSHMCETGDWEFNDRECECASKCCEFTDCVCDTRPPRPAAADPMYRYSFWTTME